jgi:hypothetical protein
VILFYLFITVSGTLECSVTRFHAICLFLSWLQRFWFLCDFVNFEFPFKNFFSTFFFLNLFGYSPLVLLDSHFTAHLNTRIPLSDHLEMAALTIFSDFDLRRNILVQLYCNSLKIG